MTRRFTFILALPVVAALLLTSAAPVATATRSLSSTGDCDRVPNVRVDFPDPNTCAFFSYTVATGDGLVIQESLEVEIDDAFNVERDADVEVEGGSLRLFKGGTNAGTIRVFDGEIFISRYDELQNSGMIVVYCGGRITGRVVGNRPMYSKPCEMPDR